MLLNQSIRFLKNTWSLLLKQRKIMHHTDKCMDHMNLKQYFASHANYPHEGHISIAEKCFDIWGILKMATVKSVEPGNNSFGLNHII